MLWLLTKRLIMETSVYFIKVTDKTLKQYKYGDDIEALY
jgi:hypothetical protein